jgi:hypothetical protein
MKRVSLKISFEDLLGKKQSVLTEEQRKVRWAKWVSLAGEEAASWWMDCEGCEACIHLDGHWCKLQGLPATVNPYLSFRHGMPGMACMGAGKQVVQPGLFDELSQPSIPF